jgi:serine carboxypeptidase-like clade 2
MEEFRKIFLNKGIKVWLYSGDWDDVVPYTDTVYNLNLLRRKKIGNQEPWFVGEKNAGFYQLYDSLTLITFKGAGHWVPYFKREESYQMFYNFINNKPINTPVHLEP